MPTSALRFIRPITMRKVPAASVPTTPSVCCRVEPSSCTGPASALTPMASSSESPKTTLEWPSANQNPVPSGGLALADQLARRVVDRRDVVGVERVPRTQQEGGHAEADAEDPGIAHASCWGATTSRSTPQPTTLSPRTAATRPISARRSPALPPGG